jgi:hypothetical protein
MSELILPARSPTEAHFYLMLQRCDACKQGALNPQAPRHHFIGAQPVCTISATCRQCGAAREFHFGTSRWTAVQLGDAGEPETLPVVNPTEAASELIDLAQWLTLFRVITEQAARATDKQDARLLGYEAALCLEEALKFYAAGTDLPTAAAFFTPVMRERFHQHPEQFSRQKLLAWRERLPSLSRMREVIRRGDQARRSPRRHWWRGRKG